MQHEARAPTGAGGVHLFHDVAQSEPIKVSITPRMLGAARPIQVATREIISGEHTETSGMRPSPRAVSACAVGM